MRTDEQLQSDVIKELKQDPTVRSNEIGVIVSNGAVTLTGEVPTYREKLAAERAAKRVKGVRAIAKGITVKIPHKLQPTDEGIAIRIARILEWNESLREFDIQAEVSQGHVALSGEVDWYHQKKSVDAAIEQLSGVVGISNQITIRPINETVKEKDVRRRILSALHRHANEEASDIGILVRDGTVTLNGTVDFISERELIEDAIWSIPGVKDIIDNLRVD